MSLSCCDLSLFSFFPPSPLLHHRQGAMIMPFNVFKDFSSLLLWVREFQFFQAALVGNGFLHFCLFSLDPGLDPITPYLPLTYFPSPQHHDIADLHSVFDPFSGELLLNPSLPPLYSGSSYCCSSVPPSTPPYSTASCFFQTICPHSFKF